MAVSGGQGSVANVYQSITIGKGYLSISPLGLYSIFFVIKHFLCVWKVSKTLVFFLRMSAEYWTRYINGSAFNGGVPGSQTLV